LLFKDVYSYDNVVEVSGTRFYSKEKGYDFEFDWHQDPHICNIDHDGNETQTIEEWIDEYPQPTLDDINHNTVSNNRLWILDNNVTLPVPLSNCQVITTSFGFYLFGGHEWAVDGPDSYSRYNPYIYKGIINESGVITSITKLSSPTIPENLAEYEVVKTHNRIYLYGGVTQHGDGYTSTNIYYIDIDPASGALDSELG